MPTTVPQSHSIQTSYPYQGMAVILTGASGGIGEAIAKRLYAKGASLILNGRTLSKLTGLKSEVEATSSDSPGSLDVLDGDISEAPVAHRLVQYALQQIGHVDVLINNAAVCAPIGLLQEMSADDVQLTLDINLKGAIFMMQETLKQAMIPASSGLIVNINSIVAKTPFPYWTVYNASKAGLRAVTESVADEQRQNGIRVCGIYPGAVDTPLWEQIEPEHRLDPEGMIPPQSIADAVEFVVNQPLHVLVNDITLTPLNPVV